MQSVGAQACAKHYIGNEQETQRNPSTNDEGETILAISSNIDDRTMHELYLWPFVDAVRSGVASIMCSYNRINQTYGCENSKLLNGVLKEELGFQGYVVSDWGATHSGLQAINAGLDMDMPGTIGFGGTQSYFGGNLTMAVQNGSLPETRLDDMILRLMTPYYYLGQDNYPTIDPSTADLNQFDASTSNYTYNLTGEASRDVRGGHAQLIHDIAAQGTVLLKNENSTLPLTNATRNIGVFGNDAADLVNGLYNLPISTTMPHQAMILEPSPSAAAVVKVASLHLWHLSKPSKDVLCKKMLSFSMCFRTRLRPLLISHLLVHLATRYTRSRTSVSSS